MSLGKRRRTQEYGTAQPAVDSLEPVTDTTTYVVRGDAVPSSDEPNAIARAESGETIEVSLPVDEQPDPVFGFGPFPPAPDQEPDDQE